MMSDDEIVKSLPTNQVIRIFSVNDPAVLLAVLFSPLGIDNRIELTEPTGILQAAAIAIGDGVRVLPHKHNPVERLTIGTSESWVVMSGSIKLDLFDLDSSFIESWVLNPGAIAVTEKGGHSLTSLQSNTLVYEFKNGPYWGSDVDKLQI